jgi:tripartite-type tricarboxylate transporter receptor subunit TctC
VARRQDKPHLRNDFKAMPVRMSEHWRKLVPEREVGRMFSNYDRRSVLLGLGAAAATPSLLRAQSAFEGKTVTMIVPFPPGGGTDVAARILADRLSTATKGRFVIENRPGGGGSIGYAAFVRAPADGSTVMLTSSAITNMPFLYPTKGYDPLKETTPVSLIGSGPSLICVGPHVPASTLKEFIDLAKTKPGELTYASAGIGSGLHLSAELLKKLAGIDVKHVPYKGASLATGDLLGGRVDMIVDILSSVRALVDDKKLKALAITSKERSKLFPEIPPAAETVPGYEFNAWFGLYLPAKAPDGVAEQLHAAVASVLGSQDVKERYTVLGMETVGSSPAEFQRFMAADLEKWGRIIKELGISAEG